MRNRLSRFALAVTAILEVTRAERQFEGRRLLAAQPAGKGEEHYPSR